MFMPHFFLCTLHLSERYSNIIFIVRKRQHSDLHRRLPSRKSLLTFLLSSATMAYVRRRAIRDTNYRYRHEAMTLQQLLVTRHL